MNFLHVFLAHSWYWNDYALCRIAYNHAKSCFIKFICYAISIFYAVYFCLMSSIGIVFWIFLQFLDHVSLDIIIFPKFGRVILDLMFIFPLEDFSPEVLRFIYHEEVRFELLHSFHRFFTQPAISFSYCAKRKLSSS